MKFIKRLSVIGVMMALMLSVMGANAQDNDNIQITGSATAYQIIDAYLGSLETPLSLEFSGIGTTGGFEALCNGDAHVAVTTRPIGVEEDANCITNEVAYSELLIGHNVLAFIAHPEDDFLVCLTDDNMGQIFAPSAVASVNNWTAVNAEYPDKDLLVALPATNTLNYATLDAIVNGDGLRSDAITGTDEEIIDLISSTPGMVGLVSLASLNPLPEDIVIVSADFGDPNFCNEPDVNLVESRQYEGATQFYMYVNNDSLDAMQPLFDVMVDEANLELVAGTGLTAPSVGALQLNRDIINGIVEGRQFSRDVTSFEIPFDLNGSVAIAGAESGQSIFTSITQLLTNQFPNLTIDSSLLGQNAGIRQFCNGEVNLIVTNSDFSDEQVTACEANGIESETFSIGSQTVVLVANAGADYAICLTTDQIQTIWQASSSETVMNWSDIGDGFADVEAPLTLFGINAGNAASDLLFVGAMPVPPVRTDTELDEDPLYRAAATGNVDGALTYMSWADYLRVLGNNQENIQLVSVNDGNGCVVPSEQAIQDGSYVLARETRLVASQTGLNDVNVQSILWTVLQDSNYGIWARSGFTGVAFSDLPSMRDTLQEWFVLASTAPEPVIEPEATPEADDADIDEDMSEDADMEETEEDMDDAETEDTEDSDS